MHSLYAKIALIFFGLLCLSGGAYITISAKFNTLYQQESTQKLHHNLAKNILADKHVLHGSQINRQALEDTFNALGTVNPSIEIYLLDFMGTIIAHNGPADVVKRKMIDIEPLRKALMDDNHMPLLGDDPRDLQRRKVFSVAELREEGACQGFLYVILGSEQLDKISTQVRDSYVIRIALMVVLLKMAAVLAAGLILFKMLTGRLRRLDRAISMFKKGKRLKEIKLQPRSARFHDEIDHLEISFVQMAATIEDQLAELQKADSTRREFVANISHDLRTPLAALRGYIETMALKDGKLTADQRTKYLGIAASHCDRLGKLINDLFELSRLESDDIQVHKESFNLGELAQDVAQEFQLKAAQKHITIITNVGKALPFTWGDIGMVERIFENLLENALRFTPENGTISVLLNSEKNRITVQVSDTGTGISREDQSHIFDRFYQADKSRGRKSGHSGLGLAIAKLIVELHHGELKVESVVNSGTTFSFTLPIYTRKK